MQGFSLIDEANFDVPKNVACVRCGKIVPYNKLISARSLLFIALQGKAPVCNKCFEKWIDYVVIKLSEIYGNNEEVYEGVTKYVCQQLGYYYESNLANKKYSSDKSVAENVKSYLATVRGARYNSLSYLDTIKKNSAANKTSNTSDVSIKDISQDTIKRFGRGFAPYQYKYLQDEYDDWTTRHECNTKAQEEIFIQICFAELDIYESRRVGEDVTKKVQTLQSLLDAAKLQPKQNHNESISDAQTFGTLIDKWEDEKPIPECDEKYKDIDNIALYVDTFFRGHTCETVGIKNGYSAEYKRYMDKYTVKPPHYDEDDTTEAIFDKIFNRAIDKEEEQEDASYEQEK